MPLPILDPGLCLIPPDIDGAEVASSGDVGPFDDFVRDQALSTAVLVQALNLQYAALRRQFEDNQASMKSQMTFITENVPQLRMALMRKQTSPKEEKEHVQPNQQAERTKKPTSEAEMAEVMHATTQRSAKEEEEQAAREKFKAVKEELQLQRKHDSGSGDDVPHEHSKKVSKRSESKRDRRKEEVTEAVQIASREGSRVPDGDVTPYIPPSIPINALTHKGEQGSEAKTPDDQNILTSEAALGSGEESLPDDEKPPFTTSEGKPVMPASKTKEFLTHREKDHYSLKGFINGPFDMMIGACIVVNTLVMCVQGQYTGYQTGKRLHYEFGGYETATYPWTGGEDGFAFLEHIFSFIFIFEVILKLYAFRWSYFLDVANVGDFVLVAVTSYNGYILPLLDLGDEGPNVSIARVIRIVRVARTMRVLRTVQIFSQLRLLVKTVAASIMALFWSMCLLGLCMLVAAIFLTQMIAHPINDESMDPNIREQLWNMFGTTTASMFTMFEITFSGCWPNYSRSLINDISVWYRVFFIIYVSLVVFAMLRIITALFIKETLQAAASDAGFMINEKLKERNGYMEKLREVFHALDESGDGEVSKDEFNLVVENPRVMTYLHLLEIDVHDATTLYNCLDDGDGKLTIDEFMSGIARLKGQARAFDVVAIMHGVTRIEKALGIL